VNAVARLAVFSLILAAAFVAAAAIGRAVGPLEREAAQAEHAEEEGMTMEPAGPAGLSVAAGGLRLDPNLTSFKRGSWTTWAFRIEREDGSVVNDFDVEHERRMHLIVVRRDLSGFQHLHPAGPRGDWVWTFRFARAGIFRAFADFSTAGKRRTLGVDLFVPGRWSPKPLPAPARRASVSGYAVELERRDGLLEFRVLRDGREVRVQPYLGARGHLVILREGDLAYLHNHADEDALRFETTFPSAGSYRAFLQFRHGGVVRTAAFTIEVAE
jgi:hypothetical protein